MKIKSNFQVIYTAYTWDNILNRKLKFEESDIDKLITSIIEHSKEEMWVIDFLYWIMPYEYLVQDLSEANFAASIIKNIKKNKVSSSEEYYELLNKQQIKI